MRSHSDHAAAVEWRALSERTRARLQQMDRDANPNGNDDSLERYLSVFSDDIVAHGLVESGDTDKCGMRRHYAPVFTGFDRLKLVSEELIVAGHMAAQKYHAAGYVLDSGGEPGRRVAIRGYTLFRFGEDGLVAERWSNHDHEYRLVQWEGPQAAEKGRRLKRFLNGPSLCEGEVVGRLAAFEAALGILAPAEERESAVRACLAPGAQVYGIGDGPVGPAGLLQHYAELWEAVPDLVFHHDATLSAWGYGAVRWRAIGYVAGAFRGVGPSDDCGGAPRRDHRAVRRPRSDRHDVVERAPGAVHRPDQAGLP